jgi:hypothetical protein
LARELKRKALVHRLKDEDQVVARQSSSDKDAILFHFRLHLVAER